ncbi:MAG: MerR family transcriptional regulator [Candidatus Aminicenantes bacterium]|nr:MerR family transcriptional regulator [Candidatus Aminicenantes bacterium]
MDLRIPDKLTFKRSETVKIAKLEGKVIDYWEKEFGGFNPVVNKLGEKFYTKKDIETILKIKHWLIVEKKGKEEIKTSLGAGPGDYEEQKTHSPAAVKEGKNNREILKIIKSNLQEILTILDKNV